MSLGIDLSALPAPQVIDQLDYEQIVSQMQADLLSRFPEYSGEPHDPVTKVLEMAALRELMLRQNHNEKASQIMLAHAAGSNLDALGALPWLQVTRLQIVPADESTVPPTPAVLESDAALRRRMLLAYNQLSTAGSAGSYEFHALSSASDVADVSVKSPAPGEVLITVMSHEGDGSAAQALLDIVDTALNAETVRPISDSPVVQSVEVLEYQINAVLTVYPGASVTSVQAAALLAVQEFVLVQHRIGYDISVSAVNAALHVPGVQNVLGLSLDATGVVGNTGAGSGLLRDGSALRDGSYTRAGVATIIGSITGNAADLAVTDEQVATNTGINIVIQGEHE